MQREHKGAVQRETKAVTFADVVDDGTTIACSAVYDTLPTVVVATAAGTMKTMSTVAAHYTGKSVGGNAGAYQGACTETCSPT